jgi:heme oxygenase
MLDSVSIAPALSSLLREGTAPLHRQTEQLLGLPGSIGSAAVYGAWLGRFLGLYEPLESGWRPHPEWDGLGIKLSARTHAARLRQDLAALGVAADFVPRADIPTPASFAHALGEMYVLEGATLGGHLIARDLRARLGPPIAGATCFFDGRGRALGPMWQTFRAALDAFGQTRPQDRALVLAGAQDAFRALLAWFAPFCADPARAP